jgi:hypothetical protein
MSMDFIVFSAAFVLFIIGLAIALQGLVRRELPAERAPLVRMPLTRFVPGPERHPGRLMLIGLALMIVAAAIVAVAM